MSNAWSTRDPHDHYAYRDYRTWPDEERWELIHGEAWAMSPTPSWGHQRLSGILFRDLANFLKGKPCVPFAAPVDVFLPEPGEDPTEVDDIDTIVQPDLGVVCDSAKISSRGVTGAPDLVIEIISPRSVLRDMNIKKELYGQHGCREYWIWDASVAWVTRFVRQSDGTWDQGTTWGPEGRAESTVLPGFGFPLPEIRAELGIRD